MKSEVEVIMRKKEFNKKEIRVWEDYGQNT